MLMSTTTNQVDVRGPRFSAWITTTVLVITLIVSAFSQPAAAVLLCAQSVVFAVTALRGPRNSPYGLLFAKFVAPRLGPVTEREPVAPLKFPQVVALIFAVLCVISFPAAIPLRGSIATPFALLASSLNASFAICLAWPLSPARSRRP